MRLDNGRAAGWFRRKCVRLVLQPAHAVVVLVGALLPLSASAEVRLGPGVRMGAHDVASRRDRSVQIERVKRLPGPPGCRHVSHGFYRRSGGSVVRAPMEQCNLVAIRSSQRR